MLAVLGALFANALIALLKLVAAWITGSSGMVGTFYQPPLVLIDTETLSTLPKRELVAGFCEMVKQ